MHYPLLRIISHLQIKDAHRGIGEAKPDAWKRQVQEEIDSAAQDTVKWTLHI